MIQIVVGIVLILLHIICCILVWVGICTHIINVSHVPGRFCSGVGSFVCVDPAFSNLDTIRSEKRSRRREDEGK